MALARCFRNNVTITLLFMLLIDALNLSIYISTEFSVNLYAYTCVERESLFMVHKNYQESISLRRIVFKKTQKNKGDVTFGTSKISFIENINFCTCIMMLSLQECGSILPLQVLKYISMHCRII